MAYTPTAWVNGGAPALNASHLNNIEAGVAAALPTFNVMSTYGAKGDGVTDDTAAIQAAATAAIAAHGILVFPPTTSGYLVTSTITLQPPGGDTQFRLDILGLGGGYSSRILWGGGNNTSIFKSYGWKAATIQGLGIRLNNTNTGVVAWDIDHDSTRPSTGWLNWQGCHVTGQDANQTSCVGWRMGHSAGTEFSFMNWTNCSVEWAAVSGTPLGWVMEDNNGVDLVWTNCSTSYCGRGWTTTSTAGANQANGNGSMFFYGCGGSFNSVDFDLTSNTYLISGGRFESGQRFLNMSSGTTVNTVTIQNVMITAYNPTDSTLISNDRPGALILDNVIALRGGSNFDGRMIFLDSSASGATALIVRGGAFQADDPFFDNFASVSIIEVHGVGVLNSIGQVIGSFADRSRLDNTTALTYSATIATDSTLSRLFTIVATNGSAFTISNPTGAIKGRTLTYDIKNSSGGALGAITWGGNFLLAGSFTNPANTKRRTISFYYDGTNWIETNRAAADI